GLTPHVPQGAYYILADASAVPGADSREKARRLLETTGVASVPGEAFFHDDAGDDLLRFCYAKPEEQLDDACKRLGRMRLRRASPLHGDTWVPQQALSSGSKERQRAARHGTTGTVDRAARDGVAQLRKRLHPAKQKIARQPRAPDCQRARLK